MAGTKNKAKLESLKLPILFPFPLYEKLKSQAMSLPKLGCVLSFLDMLINCSRTDFNCCEKNTKHCYDSISYSS